MNGQGIADIAELDRLLRAAGAGAEAAEAHGEFCGRVCLAGAAAIRDWQHDLLLDARQGDVLAQECGKTLEQLAATTLLDLEAGDMRFRLVLPSDDVPLQQRTAALIDWCQGFMHGLVAGGGADCGPQADALETTLISEILDDFTEITRAALADEGEEAEQAFVELAEYVRVSAQLIYDETASLRTAPGASLREH